MWRYLLKRILIFIPTVFAITLVSFIISLNAPGDPVDHLLTGGSEQFATAERAVTQRQYLAKKKQLGLDLPVFYFSFSSLSECDTLHKIYKPGEQEVLSELTSTYGNWKEIQDYYISIVDLENAAFSIVPDSSTRSLLISLKLTIAKAKESYEERFVNFYLGKVDSISRLKPSYFSNVRAKTSIAQEKFNVVVKNATPWKNYVPTFHWYGAQNQYHNWLKKIIKGDFGISYYDKRPVMSSLKDAIPWSLFTSIFSIILAYLISIPLGVYSVRNRNTGKDRAISTFLFVLYSLPTFWVATMMLTYLCNPEYLYIFPSSGVMSEHVTANWSFLARMTDIGKHLILPTICYTYAQIAFLSRQMRAGMLDVIQQDYIRTARAKGLSEKTVIWKHAMRNSLLPLITHFAGVFPALVGGSFIIESIFAIPGMGRLSLGAIFAEDHPTIIAIFTIGAILTLVGILIGDILYTLVDPRISFSKRK